MTAHTISHANFIMLQMMPIMLNYAFEVRNCNTVLDSIALRNAECAVRWSLCCFCYEGGDYAKRCASIIPTTQYPAFATEAIRESRSIFTGPTTSQMAAVHVQLYMYLKVVVERYSCTGTTGTTSSYRYYI